MDEDFLREKLARRTSADAFRKLTFPQGMIDFCSNDYLGIVKNNLIQKTLSSKEGEHDKLYGSTGSRLLSGNYELIGNFEKELALFHEAESALIFNSGYDANIGLLSAVAQRGDVILYDQLCHASIRDGIRLSLADAHSFAHNDITDLENKLTRQKARTFVVTESVFSMDGDTAPLQIISALCERFNAGLIVDEAHSTGVIGVRGEGLVQLLNLQNKCFARIHTFGKAIGSHGAVILGSHILRDYLINFSRSFIFTTTLPASSILATSEGYAQMKSMNSERTQIKNLVDLFQKYSSHLNTISSDTPIQAVVIPGNSNVRRAAIKLQENNFDVRPILYPTVPEGTERLRIVLHSFNSSEEVVQLLRLI